VDLVSSDVLEEQTASIIRVECSSELGTLAVVRKQLLITANVVPSSLMFLTLMIEAICSSETSLHTRATRRQILEDGMLHNHRREILKSCGELTGWALYWRRNVSSVRCELGLFIPEEGILHRHRRENLKS
jgi:hypothetical protein